MKPFCHHLNWETLAAMVRQLPANLPETVQVLDDMALWAASSDQNAVNLFHHIGPFNGRDENTALNVKHLLDRITVERS